MASQYVNLFVLTTAAVPLSSPAGWLVVGATEGMGVVWSGVLLWHVHNLPAVQMVNEERITHFMQSVTFYQLVTSLTFHSCSNTNMTQVELAQCLFRRQIRCNTGPCATDTTSDLPIAVPRMHGLSRWNLRLSWRRVWRCEISNSHGCSYGDESLAL